jgi:hypothetical protein
MSSATPHRIDPPRTTVPRIAGGRLVEAEPPPAATGQGPVQDDRFRVAETEHRLDLPHTTGSNQTDASKPEPANLPSPEDWLRLQASDLVDRLQAWASDLDAREAQLNARASLQDHRERRFRLRQQDAETELAEQQRSIGRLRHELQAQARRLAFLGQNGPNLPLG